MTYVESHEDNNHQKKQFFLSKGHNLIYCQVGFYMCEICFGILVHNVHNKQSMKKDKRNTAKVQNVYPIYDS